MKLNEGEVLMAAKLHDAGVDESREWVEAIVSARLDELVRSWQMGGWADIDLTVPPGAIPKLAVGQQVTDWLWAKVHEIKEGM